jgi:hypothetical protein
MTTPAQPNPPEHGQLLIYSTEDGELKIDVRFEGETVWLTQQHMAELFQTTQQNVSLHLQNIYEEGELQRGATHKEVLLVRPEGNRHLRNIFVEGELQQDSVIQEFLITAAEDRF